jgi:hypothetical protein
MVLVGRLELSANVSSIVALVTQRLTHQNDC